MDIQRGEMNAGVLGRAAGGEIEVEVIERGLGGDGEGGLADELRIRAEFAGV